MYDYIEGVVTNIESNYITVDVGGIGYLVYTALPYSYALEKVKVYLYQNVKEDELSLYGFKTKEERNLFLKLISVKGVGCKMALPMLAGDASSILTAIEEGNISYLKKFPKIGDKVARQMILDLKGKLITKEEVKNDELEEALLSLGYKKAEIMKVIPKLQETKLEKQIKEALRLLVG